MDEIHTLDEASIFIIGSGVNERLSLRWHDHKAGYCKVCFIVLQHNIGSLLAAIMTGICWREICLFLLLVKCGWNLRENTNMHAIFSDRRNQMCPLFGYKGHTRILRDGLMGRTLGWTQPWPINCCNVPNQGYHARPCSVTKR